MKLNYDEIVEMKCTEINSLPENQISEIINTVIDYYYENGFPYYPLDKDKIKKEVEKLIAFDVSNLELEKNELQQNMLGLNTVNTFHPEMWSTQCRNSKTPMDVFLDRDLFFTSLRKRIKYSVTKLRLYNIRKSLKGFGAQSVSNFKPTVAKWVYEKFSPLEGKVLDPCMGYGGRLMGAMCSNHVKKYVGVDPNAEVHVGNLKMHREILAQTVDKTIITNAVFHKMPFEDFETDEQYNLVFTSPPYFNVEKYSDQDKTQSYVRYPNYGDWVELFLKPLIINSHRMLYDEGYLVLNVGAEIIDDALKYGNLIFNQEPQIYYMRLSKIMGSGDKNKVSHKNEPIFIWRK